MPKFTQGKWIFHDEYILTANKGRMIADVMATHTKDEFNANGRLIASAPEMYRWLLEVLGNEKIHKSTERAIEKLIARIDGEEDNA